MLTLEDLRKIDPELSNISDADLEEVRTTLYELGQLAYDVKSIEKDGSKNPVGSLTEEKEKDPIKLKGLEVKLNTLHEKN